MSHCKTSRGFTLAELLMVMAFISIMAGVTFVSLSGKRDTTALKAAGREVAGAVRSAQTNALAGSKKGVPSGRSLCWNTLERVSENSYQSFVHYADNSGNCGGGSAGNSTAETYTLKNGVTFSSASWNVSFEVPRGDVKAGSTGGIELTKNGKTLRVCVSASGIVTEKEIDASCP